MTGRESQRGGPLHRTPGPRVTIHDVAAAAGVSVTTVSHALSGKRHVAPDTVHIVRRVVEKLGYEPYATLRDRLTRPPRTLGFVVPDILDPGFATMVRSAEATAASLQYRLLLGISRGDAEREEDFLELLYDEQILGLVVVSGREARREHLDDLFSDPLIEYLELRSARPSDILSAGSGAVEPGRHVGQHLLADGRPILRVGVDGDGADTATAARHDGAQESVDITVPRDTVACGVQVARDLTFARRRALPAVVEVRGEAVVVGLVNELTRMGYSMPHDVLVVAGERAASADAGGAPHQFGGRPWSVAGMRAVVRVIESIEHRYRGARAPMRGDERPS